jgi:glycosyltransferase involved in cell wall biosynthesis
MIHHMKNGYMAKLKSSEDLAEGINILLSDQLLRDNFSEESRKSVIEKFRFSKVAQQYQDVYQNCIDKKK